MCDPSLSYTETSDSERNLQLETEDRTHFSYFIYKDLRESGLSKRAAAQQIPWKTLNRIRRKKK